MRQLRELADNRERRDWLKVAALASWVNVMAGGKAVDPMTLIPPTLQLRGALPVKKTEEQEKAETRAALMLMGECLKQGY